MTGLVEFKPAVGFVIPAWHGSAAPQAVIMADGRPGYLRGGDEVIWVPWGTLSKETGDFTIRPLRDI